jgi:peptidoglycan/xylan/chitin deacetylase (PgdA/CDA1 family)
MKAYVLTYHSHHVVGSDYANNDHVAFAIDLESITQCGFAIVSLNRLVDRFIEFTRSGRTAQEGKYVAITFDDGPVFDVEDFVHPAHGPQLSFKNAMLRFRDNGGHATQPELHATAFVIASPIARRTMEEHADPDYTYLSPGSLSDAWWCQAIESGLIGIANHSWDHLHPALAEVAHSRQARADFTQVDNEQDADAQILAASRFIGARTGGRAAPFFAYPFGHYNRFLEQEYFPLKSAEIGIRAAFTTEPRAIAACDSQWSLPRLTCGHHWKTAQDLVRILGA